MEVLVRWATVNWQYLRAPLDFDRDAHLVRPQSAVRLLSATSKTSKAALNKFLLFVRSNFLAIRIQNYILVLVDQIILLVDD